MDEVCRAYLPCATRLVAVLVEAAYANTQKSVHGAMCPWRDAMTRFDKWQRIYHIMYPLKDTLYITLHLVPFTSTAFRQLVRIVTEFPNPHLPGAFYHIRYLESH